MSILIEQANSLTSEEAKNLGNVSAAIKTAGCHDLKIVKCYETTAETWSSMTVEFETPDGETVKYQGFFGVPKDASAEAVDKAATQTKRVTADISRIVKAAGLPDIKAAAQGAVAEVDEKGRQVTVFPKVANKKLIGTTYTVIDGQKKDGQIMPDKVFVKQELDVYKFLTKDGKDGMGRDCRESFDTDAKSRIEIAYSYDKNPKHIAKLAELTEKLTTQSQAQAPLAAMPSAESAAPTQAAIPQPAVMPTNDDI